MALRRLVLSILLFLSGSAVSLTVGGTAAVAAPAVIPAPAVTDPPVQPVSPQPAGEALPPVVIPATGEPFHTGDQEPSVDPPSFNSDDVDVVVDPGGKKNKAGGSPVSLQKNSNKQGTPSARADSPGRVRFHGGTTDEVKAATRAGASGFVFRVSRSDGKNGASRVGIEVDLSAWVKIYGEDWLSRAQVQRIPSCALITPDAEGCRTAEPVAGDVDPATRVLTADVDVEDAPALVGAIGKSLLPAATGDPGWAYQINAGIAGASGNWGGTGTWTKGAWNVSGNTGSFNWSWPISVPPAVAASAPELAVSYSSASLDGIGGATGAGQGDDFGPGWSLDGIGYVERRYKTCADAVGSTTPDMCWAGDNGTISFGGRASELIAVTPGSNEYRLKDDPAWRVFRNSGAPGSPGVHPWNNAVVGNGLVDDKGDSWVVYTPDGTAYYFGLGYEPTPGLAPVDSPKTSSVQAIPVRTGGVAGVCNTGAICGRAYRWNLDRKIDRNGNVTTYFWDAEVNWYGDPLAPTTNYYPYVRSSHISRIEYGKKAGAENVQAPAKIDFTYNSRDVADYPSDASCSFVSGLNCKQAPTFYAWKMMSSIVSSTSAGGGAWTPVWQHTFGLIFPPVTGEISKYMLQWMQRAGWDGTAWYYLPAVRTDSILMNNLTGTATPLVRIYRINEIQDEYGSDIRIYYGQPTPCASPVGLSSSNNGDCFPQWTANNTSAGFRWFNKWLATAVDVHDSTGNSPTMRTVYTYSFDTAGGQTRPSRFRFNDDRFLLGYPGVGADRRTWSLWSGYPMVSVAKGPVTFTSPAWGFNELDPGTFAPNEWTETRYYTGQYGDCVATGSNPCATLRTMNAYLADGTLAGSITGGFIGTDAIMWLGRPYQIRRLNSVGGTELAGSTDTYTAGQNADNGIRKAFFVAGDNHTERTLQAGLWKTKTTATQYDTSLGLPYRVVESGTGVTTRCRDTVYVAQTAIGGTPAATWLASLVSWTALHDTSNTACGGPQMDQTTFGYDNGYGNVITITRWSNVATGAVTVSNFEYDSYGRVTKTIDPLSRATTAVYWPATGFPSTVTITPPAPGLATQAVLDARFGVVTQATEYAWPSNATTTAHYDPLGRRDAVQYPGTSGVWDALYTYSIPGDPVYPPVAAPKGPYPRQRTAPIVVKSSIRQAGNTTAPATPAAWIDSYTYLDGLLRTRETQSAAVSGAAGLSNVTATLYDGNGRVKETTAPFAAAANPGVAMVTGAAATGAGRSTITAYDALSRPISATTMSGGAAQWATTYSYDGLMSTTQPPAPTGSTVQTEDVFGRLTNVVETGGATMNYTYNARNDLLTVSDSAGNLTTNTYDDLSRTIASIDPDQGRQVYTFDVASRLVDRTDGKGQIVRYSYDNADRKTLESDVNYYITAEWQYDSSRSGQLYRSCAPVCSAPVIEQVIDNYNTRSKPLSTTTRVPAWYGFGSPDTANSSWSKFTYNYTYDDATGAPRVPPTRH